MSAASQSAWRPLKAVLGGLVDVPDRLEVSDITQDSRAVIPGAAFFACRGRTHHGLEFVEAAVAAGARAVLWEPGPGVRAPALDSSILVRPVANLAAQLGYIADRFFGAPSASMAIAGITGTNGKTTCAWLLAQALNQLGRRAAYIGTIGVGVPGALRESQLTTLDALTLQRELAGLRGAGVTAVAMEISSVALDQDRIAGLRVHTAVFTNLTRDHIDYHGDMTAYAAAKAKLFAWPTLVARIVNVDDAFGLELARERLQSAADSDAGLIVTSRRAADWAERGVDFVATRNVISSAGGLELDIESSRGAALLRSRLIGDFNVDNLLTVLAVLLAWDIPMRDATAALARCSAPPGRMQPDGGEQLPLVLVDYAHTPDALANALRAAREHCAGKLWCVFGCGGDRDPGKRREMGLIAGQLADQLIVTDDNPRREDPHSIVAAVMQGVIAAGAVDRTRVEHDRAAAIRGAVSAAAAGDVVLVAGKGHETYQQSGNERRPFSDASVVHQALLERSAP
ncbi:MAG TPA: UDP-N-acetylmuramoyl-L-alanyl-D-glutamate--2,6-diaminopimelate ligase [Steroidobacteraceae bacterium]|jgi:UDP-N-acetylmuramoyl-L-alanyl-D-glutamate--2,6-diaminopimelate ligase|nr:UDP-N-acetylmuramoyl-L-alanyl-D-glutamate--2,6-diaminopimelate ligase [Steroidobacteraceae bacterium]